MITLFPNNNSPTVTFDLSDHDSVTVHYVPTNCIYIDVQPPGAGIVTVNGNTLNNYPNLESLSDSINHLFDVTANPGYTFNNWDWGIHVPSPSTTSTNTVVYTYIDDTVIVNFDQIIIDTVVYIVSPPGSGTISVDATNITTFPSTENYVPGSLSNLTATATTGYTFNSWNFNTNTPTPNSTSNNVSVTWSGNDTCYVNFDLVPIDTVVYTVNPPGAGTITVDGTNINTFPSTQFYSQGNTSNFSATPNVGFTFANWDFDNNAPFPNAASNNMSITWISNDSAVVNFNVIPTFDITYITDPVGGGNIDIDGVNTTVFPTTNNYFVGTNVTINANNNPNFTFTYWETNTTTINPNINTSSADFTVSANDTVIAHYDEYITDTMWVITNPPGAATLEIGSDAITTSPFMGIYEVGEILNIKALPNGSNIFNQWNLSSVGLADYNATSFFIYNRQDTLYAYFNNVLGIDDLGDDISSMKLYPTLVDNNFTVEIDANESSDINIEVYNLAGQKVSTVFEGQLNAGLVFKENFEVDLTKGIYLVKINTDKTSATQKNSSR